VVDARESLPSRNSSDALVCSSCGHVNPPPRRFCSSCGENLWQICATCGTQCTTDEKFCGDCGTNLAQVRRSLVEEFDLGFREAQRLRDEQRHAEALALLETLTGAKFTHLNGHAAGAARLIAQVKAERDQAQTAADAAFQEARRLAEQQDWPSVAALLEGIPPATRSPAVQALLAEAEVNNQEVRRLEKAMLAAWRSQASGALLAAVTRLLELTPQHRQAQTLAQQLGQRLAAKARQLQAGHRYGEALRVLDKIPLAVVGDEIRTQRQMLAELSWMVDELRTAPFATPVVAALADRFARLAPGDPHAPPLVEEIRRRLQFSGKSSKALVPPWSRKPDRSALGVPLDWMTGFQHLDLAAVRESPALLQQPGRFYVACGLALQGLGHAQLQTNLLPTDESSVIGRIAKIMPRRAARTAWGLDLGSSSVKAVLLTWDEAQGRIAIKTCDVAEYRKPLSHAANDTEARTLLGEAIQVLQSRNKLSADRVCVGLPGLMVLHRMLKFPPIPAAKLDHAVQVEVRQQFPKLSSDLLSAYHVMEPPEAEGHVRSGYDLVLVLARRGRVKVLYELLRELGIAVDAMQSDCLALHNFLTYEHQVAAADAAAGAVAQPAVALIDVGGDASSVIVGSPRVVWFQNIACGGVRFSRAIAQADGISYGQAEQLKRDPSQAEWVHELYAALAPAFEEFLGEIRLAFEAFHASHGDHRIDRVFAVGGGLLFHGLLRYLRTGQVGPISADRNTGND